MANSVETLSLLQEKAAKLQEENDLLAKKVEELNKTLNEVEAISFSGSLSFPAATAKLKEANNNLVSLSSTLSALKKADLALQESYKKQASIKKWAATFTRKLPSVRLLAENGLFDASLSALRELSNEMKNPLLEGSVTFSSSKEILDYSLAAVSILKAEDNIAKGLAPLSEEEAVALLRLCEGLDSYVNPADYKESLLDEARGIFYLESYLSENGRIHTVESYTHFLEAARYQQNHEEGSSELTSSRGKLLHESFVNEFNELSYEFFENVPNYDKALDIYRGVDALEKEEIDHYAYKEASNEHEFYLKFLESSALKKSASAFNDSCLVYAKKAASGDSDSFEILEHFVALPLLDSTKFDMALSCIKDFDFNRKLQFFEGVTRLGIDKEKAERVYEEIKSTSPKRGDLEVLASSLHYLNFHIEPSLREEFEELRLGLLRSPHSHKVKVKSTSEVTHSIFGEGKGTYGAPLGKKVKSTRVSFWSKGTLAAYWVLGVILPLLFVAIGTYAMTYFQVEYRCNSFIYVLPFALLYVVSLVHIYLWFGFDERGSQISRRILEGVAMLLMVLPLLYWIKPLDLPMLSLWSMPVFASSLLIYFVTGFLIKERNKKWNYALLIPYTILTLSAVTFMILDGIKGLIH